MIEYMATILNTYEIQEDHDHNLTAYEDLHGHEASEKLAEFGERVLFWIPVRRRAKLDLKWGAGIFLGTTMHSNEAFIGLESGDVVRSRALCRVQPSQRWSRKHVQALTGSPSRQSATADDAEIEGYAEPHVSLGEAQRKLLEREDEREEKAMKTPTAPRELPSLRITRKDIIT